MKKKAIKWLKIVSITFVIGFIVVVGAVSVDLTAAKITDSDSYTVGLYESVFPPAPFYVRWYESVFPEK